MKVYKLNHNIKEGLYHILLHRNELHWIFYFFGWEEKILFFDNFGGLNVYIISLGTFLSSGSRDEVRIILGGRKGKKGGLGELAGDEGRWGQGAARVSARFSALARPGESLLVSSPSFWWSSFCNAFVGDSGWILYVRARRATGWGRWDEGRNHINSLNLREVLSRLNRPRIAGIWILMDHFTWLHPISILRASGRIFWEWKRHICELKMK